MLEPLLAVKLLFQSKSSFSDLPHVVTSVSTFLDSSVELPLHKACKFESIQLLERIWSSSQVYATTSNDFAAVKPSWSLGRYLRSDRHYRQYQLTLSLTEAARQTNVPMTKWLLDHLQGCAIRSEVVVKAVAVGCLEMLKLFLEKDSTRFLEDRAQARVKKSREGHYVEWSGNLMETAILHGHSSIAWWLKANLPDVEHDLNAAFKTAVGCGDIAVVTWLYNIGAVWPDEVDGFTVAQRLAVLGRLDVLQWMDETDKLDDAVGALTMAAEGGHLDVARWLIYRDARRNDDYPGDRLVDLGGEASLSIHAAAVNRHLELAKYLRVNAIKPSSNLERHEEKAKQHKKTREMHRSFGCFSAEKVSASTMATVAKLGFLEVVQWLYAEYGDDPTTDICNHKSKLYGCPNMMDAAASNGYLDVLRYLNGLRVSVDVNTKKRKRDVDSQGKLICTREAMRGAARGGHLTVVQWLRRTRRLSCTSAAMDSAAAGGHLNVLQWLQEHSSEKCSIQAMNGAAQFGHLHVVKWLHYNTDAGCTTKAMDAAAENGHLDVVKWLHRNRTEGCTTVAMDHAARNKQIDMIQWLHRNRSEGCSTNAAMNAATCGDFEMLLYLRDRVGVHCPKSSALETFDNGIPAIHDWILENYPSYREELYDSD